MSQSLAKVLVHVIFSTKLRRPAISQEVREPLHGYLVGILRQLGCSPILVNSTADHVHILCCLSRVRSLAQVIEEVKKGSSKWVKAEFPACGDFYWQSGYGVFSVSQSNMEEVRKYIADQEAHHRRRTFQEEFRAFLERHGVEYDDRYVWD